MQYRVLTAVSLLLTSSVFADPLGPWLEKRAVACARDNCARAVTGTNAKPALATRSADCRSFLNVVVTPVVTTTVATTTVTSTQRFTFTDYNLGNQKREIDMGYITSTPTAVPQYASACSGVIRYDSACSCFGLTGSTITASTSTVKETATKTTYTIIATTVAPAAFCNDDQTAFCRQSPDCVCGIDVATGQPLCANDGFPVTCAQDSDCIEPAGDGFFCAGVFEFLDTGCVRDNDGTCPVFT